MKFEYVWVYITYKLSYTRNQRHRFKCHLTWMKEVSQYVEDFTKHYEMRKQGSIPLISMRGATGGGVNVIDLA